MRWEKRSATEVVDEFTVQQERPGNTHSSAQDLVKYRHYLTNWAVKSRRTGCRSICRMPVLYHSYILRTNWPFWIFRGTILWRARRTKPTGRTQYLHHSIEQNRGVSARSPPKRAQFGTTWHKAQIVYLSCTRSDLARPTAVLKLQWSSNISNELSGTITCRRTVFCSIIICRIPVYQSHILRNNWPLNLLQNNFVASSSNKANNRSSSISPPQHRTEPRRLRKIHPNAPSLQRPGTTHNFLKCICLARPTAVPKIQWSANIFSTPSLRKFALQNPGDFPNEMARKQSWRIFLNRHKKSLHIRPDLMQYNLESSHDRVAAKSPWAPHMRNSISHPKNDFEGIRSLNPRPSFYALVQKYNVLVV